MKKIVTLANELPSNSVQSNKTEGEKSIPKVLIIDGMAVVNRIDTEGLKTCKDFSRSFLQSIESMIKGYTEIRLIFDRYN